MRELVVGIFIWLFVGVTGAQDVFTLKPELVGEHPRILFTEAEAKARAILARQYMPEEYQLFLDDCRNGGYPGNASILGQQQWWYFSRLAIGIAMSDDRGLINKGISWLNGAVNEKWVFDPVPPDKTVGLDVAHKLAGFAILYDCVYDYLTPDARTEFENLLKTGLVKFRTHGYDIGDYWTNDYQNNHMHFRATASLYCAAILADKYPELQNEFNNVTRVWRRIAYMMPHDGSNHEGLNYSNYGGQMLYPGIYALRHCTGTDLTTGEHYRNVGYYYIHHLVPGMVSGFGFGDAGNSAAASGPNYLFQIANFTRDPYIQYTAHQLREKYADAFFLRQWFILFNDPLLAQKPLTDLPTHRYFEDLGVVVSRSDWGADANAVAFKCGPMGGKLLNETRGTEYSWNTDYVNVAHDDPDAGTFLLFSKGSFLTTGDGYEKEDKVTSQHSTFIVDDLTQYGGGGGWSQPKDQDQYAYPRDYYTVDNRVVFSGDMKGVYPNMERLDRTFVSHGARYIVIYDDAVSSTAGRTFEWRLQTKGTLTGLGDDTYAIRNGKGNALAGILYPQEADWSTTTNKIGNILRARLSNQNQNRFMVVLWPDAENLDSIVETYDNVTTMGMRAMVDGMNEYTLFRKEQGITSTAGDFRSRGSVLLATEDPSASRIKTLLLVDGDTLIYKGTYLFWSSTRVNFGIEQVAADTSEMICSIGPSSSSETEADVHIGLGGLKPEETYYFFTDDTSEGTAFTTDHAGEGGLILDLDETVTLRITKKKINLQGLVSAIADARELLDGAVEGDEPGEYMAADITLLEQAIDSAEHVLETATLQGEVDEALEDLLAAMDLFRNSVNVDLSVLNDLIDQANTLHDGAVEGTEVGEYEPGAKATFMEVILMAEAVAADSESSQTVIDATAADLAGAMALFLSKQVPETPETPEPPVTLFSDVPYYGDFLNYTANTESIWEVKEEDGNYILGMSDYSNTSGQYVMIKDSTFQHFEIEFDAKSVAGDYPNDIMIVFGFTYVNNYSYIKLSSGVNESGAFTWYGGATVFSWLLEDDETRGIVDTVWTHYRMRCVDSDIQVYREDTLLFSVGPQTLLRYNGRLGVGTYYRNRAYFDNINVTRLASGVGINDVRDEAGILFPNPARDAITIRAKERVVKVRITDLAGRPLKQILHVDGSEQRVDVSDLENGIYFAALEYHNGERSVARFIVQH